MSFRRGLVRVVLLRSGGYDYAELELDQPIHLVAPNNVGKTTLIAALQFLYIDDFGCMHFAHSEEETRRHYFPSPESLILFECLSPTGFQVFGVRGLGPVHGYAFERFIFRGVYDRGDFLDGRVVRPWADVSRTLLARDLAPLEPKHLKQSLIGNVDTKGPPLALVPLKRPGAYDNFRFLFRNLLRLSRVDQIRLKSLFIDITRPRLRLTSIDLRRDYELHAKIEYQKAEILGLRSVAPQLDSLINAYDDRKKIRSKLVSLWNKIERKLQLEKLRTNERLTQISIDQGNKTERIEFNKKSELALGIQINELSGQIALQEQRLKRLDTLRERCSHFEEHLEAAARKNLEAQRNTIITRLGQANQADRKQIEKRLAEVTQNILRDDNLVERYSESLVNWLREQPDFTDDQIDDLFRILDPNLLAQTVSKEAVWIKDTPMLLNRLRHVIEGFSNDGFSSDEVDVSRRAMRKDSAVSDYQNPAQIRARLEAAQAEEKSLRRILGDISEREQLQEEVQKLDDHLREAVTRLREWEEWRREEPGRDNLIALITSSSKKRGDKEGERKELSDEREELSGQKSKLEREAQQLERDRDEAEKNVRGLTPPQVDWLSHEGVSSTEDPLALLIETYRSQVKDQRVAAEALERLFAAVEKATAARYTADTEAATISSLQDQLKALADREHDVQELWKSLVDGMKNGFKALLDAVEELRKEVGRLNRALSVRRISNLKRVELELVPQKDLVQRLSAVLEENELPLFADAGAKGKAKQKMIEWLEEGKRIELPELFDLHFKVEDHKKRIQTFTSLSEIHSEGTSTTIKVLVHLELLKNLLTDDPVAIPFFLDEVATLDEKNLLGLVTHATEMSFVPVLASPEPRECVRSLYFLRSSGSGMVLDKSARMTLPSQASHAD